MATDAYSMIYSNPLDGRDIELYDEDEQVTVIRVRTKMPVTPGWLAYRIAQACAGSALRDGESVSVDGLVFTIEPGIKTSILRSES